MKLEGLSSKPYVVRPSGWRDPVIGFTYSEGGTIDLSDSSGQITFTFESVSDGEFTKFKAQYTSCF